LANKPSEYYKPCFTRQYQSAQATRQSLKESKRLNINGSMQSIIQKTPSLTFGDHFDQSALGQTKSGKRVVESRGSTQKEVAYFTAL
jgi:hypothetical protein